MEIDKKILAKYNIPVPRYTSYPPANHFEADFSERKYFELIEQSNLENPEHIAFYIHMPFCKKICFYCGCNSVLMPKADKVEQYVAALKKEIAVVISKIDKNRKVSQIHYGGGTPNAIDSKYLKEINQIFFDEFEFIEKPEIAIECHPWLLDYKYVDDLFDAGFNRFSLGIQDFNEEVLNNVNRMPSNLPVKELVAYLKSNPKCTGVNLDFIYGLSGQTKESFIETIKKAVDIKPDRIVTFSYAHVPWFKKHQEALQKIGLPTADEKTEMFKAAYDIIEDAGYLPIGFDHFALPDDELSIALQNKELHRNFQGYCTRRTTGQVYAFGVSGISQLGGGYVQNIKSVKQYLDLMDEGRMPVEKGCIVSDEQKAVREVINQLMCNGYINWGTTAENLGIEKDELLQIVNYNNTRLEAFANDGLLSFSDDEIQLTEQGNFFVRNIAASFDPAYEAVEGKHSKVV